MEHTLKAVDFRFFIGCPCYIFDTDQPVPSTIEGIDGALDMVISERVNYPASIIKPVLRRFEIISRHEVEQLNKLWPKENVQRTTYDSIQLDAVIINYLTSINVDVFGWIDKGLAIDAAYNSTTQKNMVTNSIDSNNDDETHFTRTGYNGDYTYDSICGKKIKGSKITCSPEKTTCPDCLAHDKYKIDLTDFLGSVDSSIKRRIYIESDILQADELRSAKREAYDFAEKRGMKCTDRVFNEVLEYAWHDLENTWEAVKKADEIYATSSLMPLSEGSYVGAPVIFNGMCERAVKENVIGKSVIIFNILDNIDWGMIDMKIMKKAFKNNDLYMYDESYVDLIKIDVGGLNNKT